eukprot:12423907-Karenia_brevis.AAC.1
MLRRAKIRSRSDADPLELSWRHVGAKLGPSLMMLTMDDVVIDHTTLMMIMKMMMTMMAP